MGRMVLIVAAGWAALLCGCFVLGLGPGGGGGHGAIGWGATAAGVLVHASAVAVLRVVGRRVRGAERSHPPASPGGRFGPRAARNADRVVPIAGSAPLLLLLAALTGPTARPTPPGEAGLGHLALCSVALGFNLAALAIEVVSIRSQLRLLRDASSPADPPGPTPDRRSVAPGTSPGRPP
ncbi:hypothetical protein [Tautonia plasticadhaerens]|uniref:Lipoprotein n=1 Tax=Tautonia plasticadhaerens TaxID=2527974 RepID=A0A518H2U7_9BACT|nr:hypothetical protein [Tautonia plasticadhaerens]QDV35166.1 hypothetical protein ElP_30690 [Tautonia plasticadhaerens]